MGDDVLDWDKDRLAVCPPRARVKVLRGLLGRDQFRVVAIRTTKIAAAQKTRGRDSFGIIN